MQLWRNIVLLKLMWGLQHPLLVKSWKGSMTSGGLFLTAARVPLKASWKTLQSMECQRLHLPSKWGLLLMRLCLNAISMVVCCCPSKWWWKTAQCKKSKLWTYALSSTKLTSVVDNFTQCLMKLSKDMGPHHQATSLAWFCIQMNASLGTH